MHIYAIGLFSSPQMLISRRDSPSANTNFFGVRSAAVKETVSPTLLRSEADELEKKEAKVVLRAATQLAEKEKHAQEVGAPALLCVQGSPQYSRKR
jgi:hypothetical protein